MTQRTEPEIKQNIREGKVKAASHYESIASGGTKYIFIENPSSTDKRSELLQVSVSVGASFKVEAGKNVTVDSRGSDMNVSNLKTDEPSSATNTYQHGGSYSNFSIEYEELLPGGEKKNVAVGSRGRGREVIVSDGDNFLMNLNNLNSQDSAKFSISVVFVETNV